MNRNKQIIMAFLGRKFLVLGLISTSFCLPALTQSQVNKYSLLKSAAELIAAGNLEKAEDELQTILKADPIDYQALNFLGVIRAQQQRTDEAEKLFQHVIKEKPLFTGVRVNLGLLYEQLHREDEAAAQYQSALNIDAHRSDALSRLVNIWRVQARSAVQAGELEKALALLLKAKKIGPQDPGILFDFGMVALRMSLFPDAIEAFQQELAVKTDDPNGLYALGRAQISLAKYPEAKSSFERFAQLRPDDASGHYALGLVLQSLQELPAAREQFEKSIQLQPEQTEAYFQLGLMDLDQTNLDNALQQFDHLLRRAPKHAGALFGLGRIQFEKKEYAKAASFLEQSIAADSSLRQTHYYLGLTYGRLNRKADSDKELQLASQLEHEEVEKHQCVLKILDPSDPASVNASPPPNHQ